MQAVQKCLASLVIYAYIHNRWGETPLHIAARVGHKNLVTLLLNHHVDTSVVGSNGTAKQAYTPSPDVYSKHNYLTVVSFPVAFPR